MTSSWSFYRRPCGSNNGTRVITVCPRSDSFSTTHSNAGGNSSQAIA
jgi:hypothetical protein